jgi:small-conductance mechanosensitive channel
MRRAESSRHSSVNVSLSVVAAVAVPVVLGLALIYFTATGSIEPVWALATIAGIASLVIALLT